MFILQRKLSADHIVTVWAESILVHEISDGTLIPFMLQYLESYNYSRHKDRHLSMYLFMKLMNPLVGRFVAQECTQCLPMGTNCR